MSKEKFLGELSQMYESRKNGDSHGSVCVGSKKSKYCSLVMTSLTKQPVLSRRVGKKFREEAMLAGEYTMLYRAYCGNNSHKRKISVAITPENHTEFQAILANLIQTHVIPNFPHEVVDSTKAKANMRKKKAT